MDTCTICSTDKKIKAHYSKGKKFLLCNRCSSSTWAFRRFNRYRGRKRTRTVPIPTRLQWIEVLKKAWNGKCFQCQISGVKLDEKKDALYPTLDHVNPRSERKGFKVVAAVINDMKSDLTLDEFRKVVRLLAAGEKKTKELQGVLCKLKHFKRT